MSLSYTLAALAMASPQAMPVQPKNSCVVVFGKEAELPNARCTEKTEENGDKTGKLVIELADGGFSGGTFTLSKDGKISVGPITSPAPAQMDPLCTKTFNDLQHGINAECEVKPLSNGYKSIAVTFQYADGSHGGGSAIIKPDGTPQDAKTYLIAPAPLAPK